ncbi:MAG: helix-turn-helix transcriptional regulator [Caldilineaceae bacterium]|nr:helix-turn-helix transcriptional regulator [Caldilineaceae bacterium]
MNLQIIEKDGKAEWAVIPYEVYERLIEDAEMLQDIRDYDEAKQRIADGEELIPSEVVFALVHGENPVRVWRRHRGLTQDELAAEAGISKSYLSQIESGKRQGTATVLAALAQALHVSVDDLILNEHKVDATNG